MHFLLFLCYRLFDSKITSNEFFFFFHTFNCKFSRIEAILILRSSWQIGEQRKSHAPAFRNLLAPSLGPPTTVNKMRTRCKINEMKNKMRLANEKDSGPKGVNANEGGENEKFGNR